MYIYINLCNWLFFKLAYSFCWGGMNSDFGFHFLGRGMKSKCRVWKRHVVRLVCHPLSEQSLPYIKVEKDAFLICQI